MHAWAKSNSLPLAVWEACDGDPLLALVYALDILEAREQARTDRMPGHARAQYDDSYRYPMYDAEVDTGILDPDAAAAAVIAGWRARIENSDLRR